MTTRDRADVKNTATTNAGARNSAYDSNVQILPNGDKVKLGDNTTRIGTKTYYGSSSAKEALKNLGK